MDTTKTLALLVGILAIATVASAAAYQDLPETDHTREGEDFVANQSVYVELDANGLGVAQDDEVVRNSSGAVMAETVDYNFSTDPIAVKALSGGNISDNSTATITYTYTGKPVAAQTVANLAATVVDILGLLALAAAALFVLGLTARLIRVASGGGVR